MIFIGIDPGKDGAIAYIDTVTGKIGKTVTPKIGTEVDLNKFCDFLRKLTKVEHYVVLEDVHSLFGMSAKSNFSFGQNTGHIEGMLVALGAKYSKVAPKTWQKSMWEGVKIQRKTPKNGKKLGAVKTKETSLLAVKRLFPAVDLRKSERSTNPHDGIVDALLLAEYGKRNF